jgi:mobilization protein NikA
MGSPPASERHTGRDAKARVQAPSRPRSESRQRTALVAVRLLPHERDVLAETARSRGITLSELIRASAMRAASAPTAETEARLPPGRARHPGVNEGIPPRR